MVKETVQLVGGGGGEVGGRLGAGVINTEQDKSPRRGLSNFSASQLHPGSQWLPIQSMHQSEKIIIKRKINNSSACPSK